MKWHVAMGLVLGLLAALPVGVAQEAEKPAENAEKPDPAPAAEPLKPPFGDSQPESKPTSQASGLIYIQHGTGSEASSIPLRALLNSSEMQDAAVRQAAKSHLEVAPDELKEIEFRYNPSGDNSLLTVRSHDQRLQANWVLEALRDHVSRKLLTLDIPLELQRIRDNARKRTEQTSAEWGAKRRQLADLAKRHHLDADAEVARQRRLQLALDTQRLTVELQGLNARQNVVQRQLAEILAKPNDENATKVIEEFGKVIDAKKRHVEFLIDVNKKAGGTVSNSDIERAKGAIAEAEIELAKFRREASAGGNLRATELRHRLDNTLIEIAEVETKLRELTKLDQPLAQIDDLRMEVDLMEHEYRRAREELDEIEARLRGYIPPRVVLIRTK